ncbi:hypothetical protein [Pseudoalteromonas sp. B160]|uniref:hypothetical protein n=1 Tax=Pseudoalteromonas sp. B160 TaxID=630414 RepID=UPI00301E532B
MKTNLELLQIAEELILPLVTPHVPEGTEIQAVIEQWIHAIATDSQFYSNPEVASAEDIKKQVVLLLQKSSVFVDQKVSSIWFLKT